MEIRATNGVADSYPLNLICMAQDSILASEVGCSIGQLRSLRSVKNIFYNPSCYLLRTPLVLRASSPLPYEFGDYTIKLILTSSVGRTAIVLIAKTDLEDRCTRAHTINFTVYYYTVK
jgi:hypothetical protein